MAFLIDGSNLGGRIGGKAGARDAAGVVRRLLPWARERRQEILVIFDGPPQADVAESYGPLRVAWSGKATADDRIVAYVARDPMQWTVVTADRELARRCRELGARAETSDALAARAAVPSRKRPSARAAEEESGKPPSNREEREHWRKVFEIGSSDEG